MELTQEQKEGQELMASIITKAWDDEAFKKELIANPEEAIAKLTGKKFVNDKAQKIVVTDQSNSETIYINIPAKPSMEDLELSDDQLEQVAGGGDFWDNPELWLINQVVETGISVCNSVAQALK